MTRFQPMTIQCFDDGITVAHKRLFTCHYEGKIVNQLTNTELNVVRSEILLTNMVVN